MNGGRRHEHPDLALPGARDADSRIGDPRPRPISIEIESDRDDPMVQQIGVRREGDGSVIR
jgi:hypothetical protein